MSTETRTAEQTLAATDYRMVTDYAYAVASMRKAQRDVAESADWMMVGNAQDLLERAQKVDAIRRVADSIGVVSRHGEAWTAAAAGDTDLVSELMMDTMRAAYAR